MVIMTQIGLLILLITTTHAQTDVQDENINPPAITSKITSTTEKPPPPLSLSRHYSLERSVDIVVHLREFSAKKVSLTVQKADDIGAGEVVVLDLLQNNEKGHHSSTIHTVGELEPQTKYLVCPTAEGDDGVLEGPCITIATMPTLNSWQGTIDAVVSMAVVALILGIVMALYPRISTVVSQCWESEEDRENNENTREDPQLNKVLSQSENNSQIHTIAQENYPAAPPRYYNNTMSS
ncbi:uncharacterized protein LOC143036370 [Oratosquilla oratoria]|uniref:uncharacterized protein LOC143036370 n=1 Tax=Oratosquilla oratoria TaxID=337810 RepID=UPI003F774D0C